MNYWAKRQANIQDKLNKLAEKKIQQQMVKYYATAAKTAIKEFEAVYEKIMSRKEEGKEVTPADLYKLDKYWEMQGQLRAQLRKLGEKQVALLTKNFELHYFDIYYSLGLKGGEAFSTIDKGVVRRLIDSVWVADSKTFSQRIWDNVSRLTTTLNDELINCVAVGRKTSQLKKILQERFNVSYRRAETLVRTELCHIQTEAAKHRYKDYGVQYFEVLVDPDAKTCDLCKELIGKKFSINDASPLPVHPNERCCVVPVVD